MLSQKLSGKTSELSLLAVISLMYIATCAESDMFVPAFPEMVKYFGTTEDKIQLILSLNLVGLCLASLICGPLSDAFGRKKVLVVGLGSFLIGSLGSVFAESFEAMLFWRIIQGTSASVPMVIGSAIILDKYAMDKASQLIGILNSVITAAMAGAPILGAWLSYEFNWRANFIFITAIVIVTLLGTLLFIEESLAPKNRKPFHLFSILKDYSILVRDSSFIGYSIIALLPFTAIVVYICNLSLIFINHLGVSQENFGYYQASTMFSYMIFSGISSALITKKGVLYTQNLGSLMTIVGGALLFLVSVFTPTSPLLICIAMAIFSAGGALILGIYAMKALDRFPEMKGTASAMISAIRQFLASSLVFLSEILFDGTIVPIASIIFAYLCIAIIWYNVLQQKNGVTKLSVPEAIEL